MRRTSVLVMIGESTLFAKMGTGLTQKYRDIHGFEGPIKVSFGNHTYPIKDDFLRATESQGIPTTDDLQDLVTGQ